MLLYAAGDHAHVRRIHNNYHFASGPAHFRHCIRDKMRNTLLNLQPAAVHVDYIPHQLRRNTATIPDTHAEAAVEWQQVVLTQRRKADAPRMHP
jgi:hypothetical protein